MKDKLTKVKKPAQLLKTKKKKMPDLKGKKKRKIESMTVDEFMGGFVENGVDVSENRPDVEPKKKRVKEKKGKISEKGNKVKKSKFKEEENENNDGDYGNDDEDEENPSDNDNENDDVNEEESDMESVDENEFKSHKKHLSNLKQSDPEFYKYLEENDEDLLNFDDSDVETEGEQDEDNVHKPPEELEVASDESDYELDEEIKRKKVKSNKVTREMVTVWQNKLQSKCTIQDLRDVTEAFHAALVSVYPEDDGSAVYKVEGAVVFNAVIRMCVTDFLPALQKILRYMSSKTSPVKCKNWNRVKGLLKNYLMDLAELSTVTSPNMLRVLLKHIHQLCPFIVCFPIISPKFLKRLIQIWASDEDVIRVLAFLCILRLANLRPSLLKQALKVMHLTYVRNTKFVSPNVLPGINFMRQSLSEMFALDNTISYHMVFLYIRQMAIHLRSAVTQKKKEAYKIVYNWAYVSSLHLWGELLGIVPSNSPLRSLLYPLVQIIIGTIKLISSSTYYPLRFHCCKILIHIRNKCDVFIPVAPFLLEILRDFNFSREHKKLTVKPLDFTCLLRCSKSQMKENGFKDALVENVYSSLMEYLATECYRVSFPDVTIPCVIQIKRFIKGCKFANYAKKMKSIVDKVAENAKFIEAERKKLNLKMEDLAGVEAAEASIKAKGPPFLKYYESWKKIHVQQQARKHTNNQELGDFKLPVLNKLDKKRKKEKSEGPAVLFPSDDEDSEGNDFFNEDDDEDESGPPRKRTKKEKKSKKLRKEDEIDEMDEDGDEDIEEDADYGEYNDDDSSDDDGEEDIIEDLSYTDFKKC